MNSYSIIHEKRSLNCLIIICIISLNILRVSPHIVAIEDAATTEPYKFTNEVWTATWGGPNDDKGLILIDDPLSGALFWGKSYENASLKTLGVISRVNSYGEIEWIKECSGIYGLFYSKPLDLLIDTNGGVLFVLLAFTNLADTKIALVKYSISDGGLISNYLVAETTSEYALMDWDNQGNIIILYEELITGSKVYVRHFITSKNELRNPVLISSNALNSRPIALEAKFRANRAVVCIGKQLSGGEERITLGYIDTSTNPISILTFSNITIDSLDYFPIGMDSDAENLYLFVKKTTACAIIATDDDFSVQYYKKWLIENVDWNGFILTDSRVFYCLGSGTQSFGLDTYSFSQGILLKVVENELKDGFRSVGAEKFGNPNYYDYFTGIYETSKNDLFITGYGKSYGTAPYNDFDAYLVKYLNGCYNATISPTEEPSIFEKYMVYLIIAGVALIMAVATFTIRNVRIKRRNA